MRGETVGLTIPRNYFNMSQEIVCSMEVGKIYPIYQMLLMPGDVIKVRNQAVIRQQPTISPSFSKFKVKFWDFVVAIRNLDKNFYRFLSGFEEYTSEVPWTEPLPKWIPSDINLTRPGTLWDMLENPINCVPDQESAQLDYYRQAYGYIWDLYFRNETRQPSILDKGQPGSWKGEELLRVNWDRDYFTTSLPKQILGEPQAIPISGMAKVTFTALENGLTATTGYSYKGYASTFTDETQTTVNQSGIGISGTDSTAAMKGFLDVMKSGEADLSGGASILLSQLNQMLAIETMQTINALSGIRDDEFLKAQWGVCPPNAALQYPEIFGSSSMGLITSEVLQTSQSTEESALGDMAGHGIGVSRSGKHSYHAKEFCIYLKLAYIKPETIYANQGSKREYTQNTMYDFPFVELNHIAMQPIYGRELITISTQMPKSTDNGKTIVNGGEENRTKLAYNSKILGYHTNFNWYKQKMDRVNGLLSQEQYYVTSNTEMNLAYKDNLYHWTEARFFSIKEPPIINDDFLQCEIDNRNYQITDDSIERSQFILWHKNEVDAWRSLSAKSLPSNLGVGTGMA